MLKVENQRPFIANEFIDPEGPRMRVNMAYLQKNTNLENNHNMEMNLKNRLLNLHNYFHPWSDGYEKNKLNQNFHAVRAVFIIIGQSLVIFMLISPTGPIWWAPVGLVGE